MSKKSIETKHKSTHDRAFGLRMDNSIVDALDAIATELDVSTSWVVRRACQQFIQRYQASKSTVVALAVESEPSKDADTKQGF